MINAKCLFENYRKVLKLIPETWSFTSKCDPSKSLVKKRGEAFIFTQVRYKTTSKPPPPGVTPVEPKAIPYIDPNFQPSKGKEILLLIPLITFGLGTWQVKRLKWKTNLIQMMEERMKMEAVPVPLDPAEVTDMEFRKVTVTGHFDHEHEVLYGPKQCLVDGDVKRDIFDASGRDSCGYNLITPFVVSGTEEKILVNRGWIRTKTVKPESRPWSRTEGEVTITGVLRAEEPKRSYGPKTDKRYKIWHYRDIAEIADYTDSLPIWIDATDEHSIPGKLWGGQTVVNLRNEHLSYIITWYTLSFATAYMWYLHYRRRVF